MADKLVKKSIDSVPGGILVKYRDMTGYYAEVVYDASGGGGGGGGGDASAANQIITNAKLDTIHADIAAAAPAGENHIGSIGGNTVYIDVTLSLDTSAYAAGDVVADTQAIANALRVNDGTGVLQSITVIDQDDQKAALNIFFMSGNVSLGTENSAPSISDTDALQILGPPIQIAAADYFDLGGVSVAGKDAIGKIVKAAAGIRTLYVAVMAGAAATPTYTAAGVKLRIGILQD